MELNRGNTGTRFYTIDPLNGPSEAQTRIKHSRCTKISPSNPRSVGVQAAFACVIRTAQEGAKFPWGIKNIRTAPLILRDEARELVGGGRETK